MNYFVYRNNTLENLFGTGPYSYSGYDDISYIPQEVEGFIWFYQVPFKSDIVNLANEVAEFTNKLRLLVSLLPTNKPITIFSLENLYSLGFVNSDHLLNEAIASFNSEARLLASCHSNVKFVDFSLFISSYPLEELIDWKYYFISQIPFSPKLGRKFRSWFERQIDQIHLKRKKCLILDLDNTLWGGILGEDGVHGIQIGGDYPGKAFEFFQEALIELSRHGVILTLCSKNNESDVLEVWEKNPFIRLKQEAVAAYRINWKNKADNIRELADELNIGLDSMVFIDDNPTERELVKQRLPMVEVPEFPIHPYELPRFFKQLVDQYFKVYALTEEDKVKTEQYRLNAERHQSSAAYSDLSEFIASLNIVLNIDAVNDFNLPRIAQMTQKTNQFNLTTKRYSESDLHQFVCDGWMIYCISVKDKFGDNGITGAIVMHGNEKRIEIDSLLLSCRILGKGIERVFLMSLLNNLKERGFQIVEATFVPTPKNSQVFDFYEKNGFTLLDVDESGVKKYELDLQNAHFEIENYYLININKKQ